MSSNQPRRKVEVACIKPTIQDIAFIAGFLEGDGYFGQHRTTVTVSVIQKQKWPLEYLQQFLGGTLGLETKQHGLSKGKSYHMWRVTGARARGLMMTVYKFMSPERQSKIRRALYVV